MYLGKRLENLCHDVIDVRSDYPSFEIEMCHATCSIVQSKVQTKLHVLNNMKNKQC